MDYMTIFTTVVTTIVATSIIALFTKLVKRARDYKEWRVNEIENKLSRNIDSNGARLKIVKSNYFINHRGQLINPIDTHDNECVESFDLAVHLINTFRKNNVNDKLRYLILGGSEMGKSTFIVNFFYRYIKKYNRQNVPFQIYVLYLGDPNVFNVSSI